MGWAMGWFIAYMMRLQYYGGVKGLIWRREGRVRGRRRGGSEIEIEEGEHVLAEAAV